MSIYVRYSSPSSSHETKAHVNNFGREFQTLAKKKKTRSREERRRERDFVFKEPLGCRLMTDSNVRASFYKSSGKVQVPCATQTPPIHYLHAPPSPSLATGIPVPFNQHTLSACAVLHRNIFLIAYNEMSVSMVIFRIN